MTEFSKINATVKPPIAIVPFEYMLVVKYKIASGLGTTSNVSIKRFSPQHHLDDRSFYFGIPEKS